MLYRLIEAMLTNNNIATSDDVITESKRPKNRTYNVLGIDSLTLVYSTYYPIS